MLHIMCGQKKREINSKAADSLGCWDSLKLILGVTAELLHLLNERYNKNDLALIYSSLFPPAEGLLLELKSEMGKHLLLPNCSAGAG